MDNIASSSTSSSSSRVYEINLKSINNAAAQHLVQSLRYSEIMRKENVIANEASYKLEGCSIRYMHAFKRVIVRQIDYASGLLVADFPRNHKMEICMCFSL